MNKISIIGTGSVGSTIAYTLTVMGMASEIVMIDINNEKALGEALDIRQGTPFCGACSVYAGDYRDAVGSDIVILTSGIARKPGQTRLELAQTNVNITKSIIPEVTKYAPDATYVIVSNPVDILTYTFHKFSDIPENRIIGSGTILDTARLRARLSEYYISSPKIDFEEVEQYVKKSGGRVIARKGATFYAVSVSVCHICKYILSGIDTTMTVSTMMHGEYGIDDVCLSTLNIVGDSGVRGKVNLALTDEEIKKLRHSADTLKDVINNLDI